MSYDHAYQEFDIEKDGKIRHVQSPTATLKEKQREILVFLEAYQGLPVHPASFAYRADLSNPCEELANHHFGMSDMLAFDISSFFRSIKADHIFNMLRGAGIAYKQCSEITSLACFKGALAFGSPLSPMLSNCYLFAFDTYLGKFAKGENCLYTRYCDDIFLSHSTDFNSNQNPRIAIRRLMNCYNEGAIRLSTYGLSVNPVKTRYNPARILGIDVREFYVYN